MTHYTTLTAAKKLGCHPETVKRHCRDHGIGEMVSDRLRLLSESDIKRLAKLVKERGRPPTRPKSKRRKG